MSKNVGRTGERFITFYSGYFNVQKCLNGKAICFARFKSLDDAVEYRNQCVESNWDLSLKTTKNQRSLTGLRYITELPNGHYQLAKDIDGRKVHFGYFYDLEEAKKHRDYCVEHKWSDECRVLKNGSRNYYHLPKYISYNKERGKYTVVKYLKNGKTFNITNFDNVEDAIKERDLLMKADWDLEKLIELDEAMGTL